MDVTVHEMTTDRASGKAEVTKIHAQRTYVRGDTNKAPQFYTNHDGKWCSPQGTIVEDAERDVPEEVRQDLAAHPIHVQTSGPEVVKLCEFCKEEMNSSQYDEHLKVHIRNLMLGAKAESAVAKPIERPEPEPQPIGDPPIEKARRTMSAEHKAKMAAGRERAKAAKETKEAHP